MLELSGSIVGGRFRFTWSFSTNFHRRESIETLAHETAEQLRALTAKAQARDDIVYTPADFPTIRIKNHQLDKLMKKVNKLANTKSSTT